MKRLLLSGLFAIVLLGSPAGAATQSRQLVKSVSIATTSFGVFGNNTLADCEYVADANLVQNHYPRAQITEAEVVTAWQSHPVYVYWNDFTPLNFLASSGFEDFTIASYQRIYTNADVATGANAGGVYAFLNVGQPLYHAVAIVGADRTGPIVVWYGNATQETWSWFDANMIVAYAITWP